MTFLTCPFIGNITLCCMEENKAMCSFGETETLAKEEQCHLLPVVTDYYV